MELLQRLLEQNPFILLDGALGTELSCRGVDTGLPLWSAGALKSNPDAVSRIYCEYAEAGAQMLTAATFRTTTFTFRRAGYSPSQARREARDLTFRAIELARQAAGEALVAGSMAPVGDCYDPTDYPGKNAAEDTYGELARWLKEAGVDILLLETHIQLEELGVALAAAAEARLPVLASLLVGEDRRLWGGAPMSDAVHLAEECGADGILINCVTLAVAEKVFTDLVSLTQLIPGLYANAGTTQPKTDGTLARVHSDDVFVSAARTWHKAGARIIGGCCGTTPNTVGRLWALQRELVSKPYHL